MKSDYSSFKTILLARQLFVLVFLVISMSAYSQDNPVWSNKTETEAMKKSDRQIVPVAYRSISANFAALKTILSKAPMENTGVNSKTSQVILSLPLPNGTMQRFSIIESPTMERKLAEKYPEIKTFLGQGVDDPSSSVRCDITPKGFHAMIFTTDGTVFIDPYRKGDVENYISYYKKDFIPPHDKFMIEYNPHDNILLKDIYAPVPALASGTQLRTYRLALAADSNYYNFQGGTKPLTMAAMVTSINRVNFIFEREVAIRMNIVAGNDDLIFPGTTSPYPYTVTTACALRPQNQTKIDAVIGTANYDIGHLFAMSSGGCATGNSICNAASKAWGVTGTGNPVGDPFDIDYVAHEIGHQFNGSHTWNGTVGSCSNDQYTATSAYEPGSGSTIMAYAGICGSDNLQPNSDAYFHTRSFDQIISYSTSGTGSGCPVSTSTGNAVPIVNAGANYTIPISTPFMLTGSGSDPDSDPLTFCWEEFDLGPVGPPNVSTTTGPIFRSFNPVTSTARTFPKLANILSNTTSQGEILPSITRTMTFRLTARDNRAGGGGVDYSSMTLNVTATAGPFAVTAPNSAVTWCPGPQTVTWDVNNSNTLAANVNILLSTDGGNTFPTVLAASTPNDGSHVVTIACTKSTMGRIKVEAVGNIFFDISNANFTVGDNTKPTFTVPGNITIYKDANCNYNAPTGITGDVTDEGDNCDITLNATSSDGTSAGSCVGETILTRTWTLTDDCGNSTVKVQTITITDNTAPTFTVPANITIYKDASCNYNALPSNTGDVTDEADNCDNTLNATPSDVNAVGSCADELIITRTWTLTDDCGNTTQKVQTITVKDITAPTFTVPADITIYKDANCNHNDNPSETGNVTDAADNCDATPTVTYSDVDAAGSCMGEVIITRTWRVVDNCSNATEKVQVITVKDTTAPIITNVNANPPSLWPPNHKMRDVTINYNVTDNCSDAAHITTVLTIKSNEPLNGTGDGDTDVDYEVIDDNHVRLRAERAGNGNGRIYTITITSTDDCGNVKVDSTKVYVVHNITGPNSGNAVKIGSTVNLSGVFWNTAGGAHTAKWVLDEATYVNAVVTEPAGTTNGKVTGSYKFTTAGVYRVRMDVTRNGITSYATTNGDKEQIIVVYDPNGGHTYGGGWFSSVAGSLKSNPTATGKASFGFAANYFKKSTTPKGETEFVFKVGDFEFNAINFEYLSIAAAKAQIKGTGKIKGGQSGISFIMTVLDGGSGAPDKIRMKIYNKNTNQVYYDNQTGASDADNPTTAVGDNSVIVVNSTGSALRTEEEVITAEVSKLSVNAFPNPSNSYFSIAVKGNNNEKMTMRVFDLYGRKLEERVVNNGAIVKIGEGYGAGVYFVSIQQGENRKELKLIKMTE